MYEFTHDNKECAAYLLLHIVSLAYANYPSRRTWASLDGEYGLGVAVGE